MPERSELIVRTHAPQGETVSLITEPRRLAEAKTIDAEERAAAKGWSSSTWRSTEPVSADVKIGGQTVSKWRFDLIKDEAPTISLMGNPTTTPRGALRLVLPRRRRQWRGKRRGALRARRRRGAQPRAVARARPSAKVEPIPCSSRR